MHHHLFVPLDVGPAAQAATDDHTMTWRAFLGAFSLHRWRLGPRPDRRLLGMWLSSGSRSCRFRRGRSCELRRRPRHGLQHPLQEVVTLVHLVNQLPSRHVPNCRWIGPRFIPTDWPSCDCSKASCTARCWGSGFPLLAIRSPARSYHIDSLLMRRGGPLLKVRRQQVQILMSNGFPSKPTARDVSPHQNLYGILQVPLLYGVL